MFVTEKLCTKGTVPRCSAVLLFLFVFVGMAFSTSALAQGQHGIGLTKGCQSPVVIGDPLFCEYTIINNLDTGDGNTADTLTITVLEDFICNGGIVAGNCLGKNAQPPVASGNILPVLTLTLNNGATCNAGQTLCTLPPGASISAAPHVL